MSNRVVGGDESLRPLFAFISGGFLHLLNLYSNISNFFNLTYLTLLLGPNLKRI